MLTGLSSIVAQQLFKLETCNLPNDSPDLSGNECGRRRRQCARSASGPALALMLLFAGATLSCAGQAESSKPDAPVPEAPQPQTQAEKSTKPAPPCRTAKSAKPAEPPSGGTQPAVEPCKPIPVINWFARFLNGPEVRALTPAEKARLAVRNVVDPFNALTILGTSAIAVGADSHSPYGPGMTGFGKNVGVSYSQDVTGEFFGTFLIPSIVHQDPHYHRLPNASVGRRIFHAITQVEWTQSDNGKGMVNYANLVGFAVDDAIGNLYVPGRETHFSADASRYGIGLATAPIDNFVTEFLPDVARHIHIRVVLIQRIINQVAKTDGAGGT
jgi:hypothetical protein